MNKITKGMKMSSVEDQGLTDSSFEVIWLLDPYRTSHRRLLYIQR